MAQEFDIIANLFAPLSLDDYAALGLKDDIAHLKPDSFANGMVVTTDTLVENTHFLPSDPIDTIAQKLVRVNKSDLIAKGCRPIGAMLNLTWPQSKSEEQLTLFAQSLGAELDGIPLIGGDTTKSRDLLVLGMTMFGVPIGKSPIFRSGAKPKDLVFVTGTIGDAAIGLDAILNKVPNDFPASVGHYRTPKIPPSRTAELIANFASASLDVSDGLFGDAQKLAFASGVGMELDIAAIALSDEVKSFLRQFSDPISELLKLLSFGDDYQSLFCVAPHRLDELLSKAHILEIEISQIGICTHDLDLRLFHNGRPIIYDGPLGYTHKF